MLRVALLVCALLLGVQPSRSFYVPGVAPKDLHKSEIIDVKAIKLTSVKTIVPFEYYSLPFCKPNGAVHYKSENLGELLRGDRIVNTPYQVEMLVDTKCASLCSSSSPTLTLSAEQTNLLRQRINEDYHVHLIVDNLPISTRYEVPETGESFFDYGYRLGWTESDKVYVNNHLEIVLSYHEPVAGLYRVVGFEAKPRSLASNKYDFNGKSCSTKDDAAPQLIPESGETQVAWTYSVTWKASAVPWASRWDQYLHMPDNNIHWFSILNSIIVLACLTGFVSVIILRTVRRDINKYNSAEDLEDALEETGWKLVHADVFRPPRYKMLLVNFVGTGIQLIGMVAITVTFAMLGMLSPSSRGALTSVAIFLYCLMGLVAGYHAGRLYKTLRGDQPKRCALRTALMFPAIVLGVGFLLNFFLIGKHSSGAIPFTTMVALTTLWLGLSLPLTWCGFYFGFRKQPYSHPVRSNHIPRQVPTTPWYLKTIPCSLIAGVLPFGAVFIELFFVFSAIWQGHSYYLFGFMWIVLGILFVACSQISIVVTYFLLCAESYHWQWKSFVISCGSAFYVLAYSVYYYYAKLSLIGFVPTLLYFAYSSLIAFTFAIVTGTIGYYAAYFFICRIYSAVKID